VGLGCGFFFFEILGKKMLVPLTASLYVPGTLDDADKVLVDIGTGYFVEVSWLQLAAFF
jgi:prefoldin alpha subunit